MKEVTDKRGCTWEMFIDEAYFHNACVRPKGERDFNSQLSFHFATTKQAEQFLEWLKEASQKSR